MKKNAIGHMRAEKQGFRSFLKRIHLIPLLLCMILAVILWLLVVNLSDEKAEKQGESKNNQTVAVESVFDEL